MGTMPHTFGSSGCLPILDFVDESTEVAKSSDSEIPKTDKCGGFFCDRMFGWILKLRKWERKKEESDWKHFVYDRSWYA